MDEAVTEFLAPYSPQVRDIALATRALILEVFPDAIEQIDRPAQLIGYGFDRTYAGLVCAIALKKTYANLMFSKGTQLQDPARLLEGTGKYARHVKIRKAEDVQVPAVRALLEQAVALMKR